MHGDVHVAGPRIKRRVADPSVWRCAVHFECQTGNGVGFGSRADACNTGLQNKASSEQFEVKIQTHIIGQSKRNLEGKSAVRGRLERHKRVSHCQGGPTT